MQQVLPRLQGVFFGWWIVLAAALNLVLTAGLLMQSYSAYVAVMSETFPWSRTAFALAFSIQQVSSGLLGPVQGWLIERFGARFVLRVGIFSLAISFALLSQVNSLLSFYLVFVGMAIGTTFGGFLSVTTVVVQWFSRYRSTALALLQVGVSFGGIVAPLVAWSLETYGWRSTALASALAIVVIAMPLSYVMRGKPEDYGMFPDGIDPAEPEDAADDTSDKATARKLPSRPVEVDFTLKQALRTRAFWFIAAGHASALTVVSAVNVHVVVHLNQGLGYSLQAAAYVIALMTVTTIIGHLIGGVLGDRVDKRYLAASAMFGHAIGLVALAFAYSFALVLVFATLHGLAWGLRAPLMQAMRADYFGRKFFASIMGYSFMLVMVGMMTGPIIAGYAADVLGDYKLGFVLLASIAALGSMFFLFAHPPAPPVAEL